MTNTELQDQSRYWDRSAGAKVFSHPVPNEWLSSHAKVSAGSCAVDVGCGYGRVLTELAQLGFSRTIGLDFAASMLRRAAGTRSSGLVQGSALAPPFVKDTFDLITLLAVLTCLPRDQDQRSVIAGLHGILRPGGLLLVSDLYLQTDARNQARYESQAREFGCFGVFRLPDGGVCRHHSQAWMRELLADFEWLEQRSFELKTMNGNPATAFQVLLRKPN